VEQFGKMASRAIFRISPVKRPERSETERKRSGVRNEVEQVAELPVD